MRETNKDFTDTWLFYGMLTCVAIILAVLANFTYL